MTLQEAIAEVKRVDKAHGQWPESGPSHLHRAINHILNAVASGDLIPKTDAEQAVALAYQKAADKAHECWDDGVPPPEYRDAILALAPADALAEVEKLREALQEIAEASYHMRADTMQDIARAALSAYEGEKG